MFNFNIKNKFKSRVPLETLYCVWIQARPGEDAPLIRVWIDPSMTMFESRVKVHEPDAEAAQSQSLVTLNEDVNS